MRGGGADESTGGGGGFFGLRFLSFFHANKERIHTRTWEFWFIFGVCVGVCVCGGVTHGGEGGGGTVVRAWALAVRVDTLTETTLLSRATHTCPPPLPTHPPPSSPPPLDADNPPALDNRKRVSGESAWRRARVCRPRESMRAGFLNARAERAPALSTPACQAEDAAKGVEGPGEVGSARGRNSNGGKSAWAPSVQAARARACRGVFNVPRRSAPDGGRPGPASALPTAWPMTRTGDAAGGQTVGGEARVRLCGEAVTVSPSRPRHTHTLPRDTTPSPPPPFVVAPPPRPPPPPRPSPKKR